MWHAYELCTFVIVSTQTVLCVEYKPAYLRRWVRMTATLVVFTQYMNDSCDEASQMYTHSLHHGWVYWQIQLVLWYYFIMCIISCYFTVFICGHIYAVWHFPPLYLLFGLTHILTFSKSCSASSGLSQHCTTAHTQNYSLSMTEHGCDLVATCHSNRTPKINHV